MRYLFPVSTVVLGLVLAGGVGAGDRDHDDDSHGTRTFVGLWEAIDSFDGSTQRLSITCSGKKSCDVRLNDTFFSDCDGGIGFAHGEGWIHGGVLASEMTLRCGDLPLMQFNQFVPDPKNGTLTNLNDSPGLSNVFHRISQ